MTVHDLEIVFNPLPGESLTRFITESLGSYVVAATGTALGCCGRPSGMLSNAAAAPLTWTRTAMRLAGSMKNSDTRSSRCLTIFRQGTPNIFFARN
jgi:hypothetical protein